jgi:hypothetical protein
MAHVHRFLPGRPVLCLGALVAAAAALAGLSARLAAQTGSPHIVRVEEDWSLCVNQTDSGLAAPQVSTQMARAPWAARFCNFRLNSTDLPTFAVGGLQLQAWIGKSNLNVYTSPNSAVMATDNELITWTQYMRVGGNSLYFGIGTVEPGVAGSSSQTWGDFSSGMEIAVPGSLATLDGYDPSYSASNSGVTFGANRVDSLTLVRVRYYYDDGSPPYTDYNPRLVYSSQLNTLGGDN